MSEPTRDERWEIERLAQLYVYGQSDARHDIGLARDPDFVWVDEAAFVERAVERRARYVGELRDLYVRMLGEKTHVRRFGDRWVAQS